MFDTQQQKIHLRWHSRARHAGRSFHHSFRRSLRLRLVALFLLLALAMTVIFIGGMQKALSVGWRDAVRPLVADYVDRLAGEIGSPPDIARANALVHRLPISVRISGPVVNWDSHPLQRRFGQDEWSDEGRSAESFRPPRTGANWLERSTADGHHIRFGLGDLAWDKQPRRVGWITLFALLVLTALAHAYVRRLLRPLDDIRAGAERFGAGDFSRPIPLRRRDELGDLAHRINTMAHDIRQMLDAKRAMLLAISHELRSPLTRARLNVELLPETAETQTQREALLRDLAGMRDLITGLMESERLASRHAALHLEPTDLGLLAREVLAEMAQLPEGDAAAGTAAAPAAQVEIAPGLPLLQLDRARVRLLLRNLLDNAQRHSAGAVQPPVLRLTATREGVLLQVRDHGPGVTDEQLPHLGEPFYRADAARQRATGGVGLGLYLCRLVAQAHGAAWSVRNALPGLVIGVSFPLPPVGGAAASGVPGG